MRDDGPDLLRSAAEKLEGNVPLFTGLDRVRFVRQVVPGDTSNLPAA
jgi:3-hydroxymyristoyl/3-hydroxydecanoyl-(acyl carrier protein) dehydratase